MAETAAGQASRQLPSGQKLILTIAIMMAVLLQVLDTTIANVALPHMQASLDATQDTITWVLTSYIVASAIALPITGWLADRVGRKRLLLISVIGFTAASVLCATATSLTEMVMFRAVQGVSGAFLIPLAQTTMLDINPPDRQGQAMAVFGGGIMIGPILGPVLGGWLTDSYNWRWVFLVNLPVGIICALLLVRAMPAWPTLKRRIDIFGFVLLAVGVGALQIMLDRGEQMDWFSSWEILIECGIAIAGFWMFIVHTIMSRDPLFERPMFTDRNFISAVLLMGITGVMLFAGLALLPPLLQNLYGYSVLQSGMLTAPRGFGTLVAMLLAGRLIGRIDSRLLVAAGVILMGVSLQMMTHFAPVQPSRPVIVSGIIQGLGLGLVFVPLQTLAFQTLGPQFRTNASSLLNLARSIGGSIGISIFGAQLTRMTQAFHADLAGAFGTNHPMLDPALLTQFGRYGQSALALINAQVTEQAQFIAYLNDFKLMMIVTFAVLPLLLLMKRGSDAGGGPRTATE